MLELRAREASHQDDLVTAACHWLYERKILIPGERRVQDWARDAFASIEAEMLQTIETAVPAPARKACQESVYSSHSHGVTHLEWLKTPSKRHGPTTLAETLTKIRYLKSLGVHEWALDTIARPKQRAYAQQVQARRPAKSRELKESTQTIELVCFLRISLLELCDVAMHQANRRGQQLFREAARTRARRRRARRPHSCSERSRRRRAATHARGHLPAAGHRRAVQLQRGAARAPRRVGGRAAGPVRRLARPRHRHRRQGRGRDDPASRWPCARRRRPGRLRRADERVAEFQGRIPIAAHWGNGEKASADMMSVDASRHLWNARVDPRRRTYAAGIYTHLLDRWGIVYDQPIVLNERQAGAAIEGVERHNRSQDRIRLSLLAVDTHGYTNPGMAVAKGAGLRPVPAPARLGRAQDVLARQVPRAGRTGAHHQRISLRAIGLGWDEFLRLLASICLGRISAELALQRWLGSGARQDAAHKAAEHLGRLLRSIFLCDYITIEDFRRETHTLLSRGESVHQLQRALYSGKVSDDRGRRCAEMKAISGAQTLLTNIVLAWNTHRMDDVVERLRPDGVQIDDAWLRRIGPANFGHINFRGTFSFAIDKYAEAVLRGAEPRRRGAAI